MYTLKKHKKRGTEGFKDFVKNLETFPASTVKEMLFLGLTEDPVYLKWAMENRVSFQYMLQRTPEEIMKVFQKIGNSLELLIMALKESKEEDEFLKEKFPSPLQKQYYDEREYTKVSTQQRFMSRKKMLQAFFDLESAGEVEKFTWQIPPVRVLEGEDYSLDKQGNYTQYYTEPYQDVLALKGNLEKGLRAGMWQHYYPNGELIAEGIYVSGEKAGEWDFFYPDKKTWMSGSFVDGLKEGKWQEFDAKGNSVELEYSKGSLVKT